MATDHQLLARIDERLKALEQRVEQGFHEQQERVELARDVYPTQKDVAVGIEAARSEAKIAAIDAAKQLAEKLEITAQASDKRIAAIELAISQMGGQRQGTTDFRAILISLTVLAVAAVGVVISALR